MSERNEYYLASKMLQQREGFAESEHYDGIEEAQLATGNGMRHHGCTNRSPGGRTDTGIRKGDGPQA